MKSNQMICHYCMLLLQPYPSAMPLLFSATVIPFPMLITVPVSPLPFHITLVPFIIIILAFLFLLSPFAVVVPCCHQWHSSCHPHPHGHQHGPCCHCPWSLWFSGPGIISCFHCFHHRPCHPVLHGCGPLVAIVAAASICVVVGLIVGVRIFFLVMFVHCW